MKLQLATFIIKQMYHFRVFRTLWLVFYTLMTNTCSKLKVEKLYLYANYGQSQQ